MTNNKKIEQLQKELTNDLIDTLEVKQGINIWRTVYSDMTTNLTLFFLILFAFTRMSVVKQEEMLKSLEKIGEKSKFETNKQTLEENSIMLAEKLKDIATVAINEEEVSISLPSPVLFDSGKDELKEQSLPILAQVAQSLKKFNNEIIVEGHTDNIKIFGGKFRSNWELSAARAFSVIEFLVKNGVKPELLSAVGYGEYRPKFSNDTEDNRSKNRRIEIKIIRK